MEGQWRRSDDVLTEIFPLNFGAREMCSVVVFETKLLVDARLKGVWSLTKATFSDCYNAPLPGEIRLDNFV